MICASLTRVLLAVTLACSAQPVWAEQGAGSLAIVLPSQDAAQFRGAFNYERAQAGPSPMMYPGGLGVLGFFVGVATHAAIVGGVREKQRSAAEAAGEAALQAYRPVLEGITNSALMRESLHSSHMAQVPELVSSDAKPSVDWLMQIAPVFWFSTDQRAIVLEADIAVVKGEPAKAKWRQRVWLVSRPLPAEDLPSEAWITADGERLKRTTAGLLSMAYELAMSQVLQDDAGDGAAPQRTIRYWEGGLQQIERAQVLAQDDCGRVLIKTLREELMSVPTKLGKEPSPGCER